MAALIVILGYLTIGLCLARLWLWKAERNGPVHPRERENLKTDMILAFFFWPLALPVYLGVQGVIRIVYPKRIR